MKQVGRKGILLFASAMVVGLPMAAAIAQSWAPLWSRLDLVYEPTGMDEYSLNNPYTRKSFEKYANGDTPDGRCLKAVSDLLASDSFSSDPNLQNARTRFSKLDFKLNLFGSGWLAGTINNPCEKRWLPFYGVENEARCQKRDVKVTIHSKGAVSPYRDRKISFNWICSGTESPNVSGLKDLIEKKLQKAAESEDQLVTTDAARAASAALRSQQVQADLDRLRAIGNSSNPAVCMRTGAPLQRDLGPRSDKNGSGNGDARACR